MNPPQDRFDEQYYLQAWADVQQAVRSGHHLSGYHHWVAFGQQEGRAWRQLGETGSRGSRMPPQQLLVDNPETVVDLDFHYFRHRGFRVPSCSWQSTLDKLSATMRSIRDGLVVEVGVFGGSTLLFLAQELASRGTRMVGIDPWEKLEALNGNKVTRRREEFSHWLLQLRFNLEGILAHLRYDNVQLIHDFSQSAVRTFANDSIDFLIVDGDHSEAAVARDLSAWWPKLKQDGMLWGDDYNWPEVKAAADSFCARMDASMETWEDQFIIRKTKEQRAH